MIKILGNKRLKYKHKTSQFVYICIICCAVFLMIANLYLSFRNPLISEIRNAKISKLLIVLFLYFANVVFLFTHELGHAYFANKTSMSVQGIYLCFHKIFPYMYIKVSFNQLLTQVDQLFFYIGGTVADSIIGGGCAILNMKFNNLFLLYLSYLTIARIITNLLPINQSDGKKLLLCLLKI